MAATTERRTELKKEGMRTIVRIGLWAAMLTASTAVMTWGLEAENASNDARALAVRDAPMGMIVGGAIALPSKTAQEQYDWKSGADDGDEAADESARTPAAESRGTQSPTRLLLRQRLKPPPARAELHAGNNKKHQWPPARTHSHARPES